MHFERQPDTIDYFWGLGWLAWLGFNCFISGFGEKKSSAVIEIVRSRFLVFNSRIGILPVSLIASRACGLRVRRA